MCCNQLFYFQVLWPDGDVAVDEGDLVDILHAIWMHAHHKKKINLRDGSQVVLNEENDKQYQDSVSALGVLTSLGRNQWAQAREEMILFSPKNRESLKIVDSALFVLVLDDYVPKNRNDAAANMLHGSYKLSEWKAEEDACAIEYQNGSCTNRWYDKLQVSTIQYENTKSCRVHVNVTARRSLPRSQTRTLIYPFNSLLLFHRSL